MDKLYFAISRYLFKNITKIFLIVKNVQILFSSHSIFLLFNYCYSYSRQNRYINFYKEASEQDIVADIILHITIISEVDYYK